MLRPVPGSVKHSQGLTYNCNERHYFRAPKQLFYAQTYETIIMVFPHKKT